MARGIVSPIVAMILIGLVITVFLPTLVTYISTIGRIAMENVRASPMQVLELEPYISEEINVTAFLQPSGEVLIYISSVSEVPQLDRVLAAIDLNTTTLYIDILRGSEVRSYRFGNRETLVITANITSIVNNIDIEHCLRTLIIVTKDGSVVYAKIYTPTMIHLNEPVSLITNELRLYKPLPFRKANTTDLANTFLQNGVYIGRWIDGTPPRIEMLPPSQFSRLVGPPLPDTEVEGVRGLPYGYSLKYVFNNIHLHIDMYVGNVYVLYDSSNPELYNILISWDNSVEDYIGVNDTDITDVLNTECPYGFRIKILGFNSSSGTIKLGSRSLSPTQNIAEYLYTLKRLEIRGHAEKLLIYCRSEDKEVTSYDPYVLLGSTIPRGGYGILTAFEDVNYGDIYSLNDALNTLQLDASTEPFVLIFRGIEFSNRDVIAVLISINFMFHDNEGYDYGGVTEDKPIMIIGIMDRHTGEVLSYRTLTFRELTRYEDTYPPTAEAQSISVFIPLPSPTAVGIRTFVPFVALQDPYLVTLRNNYYYDDVDVVVYISDISILSYSAPRPGE